jgi:hypothetical protein
MADEIDLNSDQVSQNLYADSDLAPLSELFGEMGRDRSFWTKVGNKLDLGVDLLAATFTARN